MRQQQTQTQPRRRHRIRQIAVRYQATVTIAAINEWL
jgi:hypothetical protein